LLRLIRPQTPLLRATWKKGNHRTANLTRLYLPIAKLCTGAMTDKPSDPSELSATVQPEEGVILNGIEYHATKEGLAYMLTPKWALAAKAARDFSRFDTTSQKVFYNPIQQFNRDLSVLAIRAYGEAVIEEKNKKREKHLRDKAERGKKRKRGDPNGVSVTRSDQIAGSGDVSAIEPSKESSAARAPDNYQEKQSMDLQLKKAKTSVGEGTKGSETESLVPDKVSTAVVKDCQAAIHKAEPSRSKDPLSNEANPPNTDSTYATNMISTATDWKPTFTILDALSATGLRALRYAKEIPFATSITANDLSDEATAAIKVNIQFNGLGDQISAIRSDACTHMYSMANQQSPKQPSGHVGRYDVIDLDPYGTAVPFLDAAVQSVNDGGLLCVTCTDSGVFASVGYLEKTYALYGGLPLRGQQSHEVGLRLIIHAIANTAARYGLAIEPLLSLSIDFYVRIFVRVRKSPAEVKFLAGKTMIVYNCDSGCGAWTTQLLARNKTMTSKKGNPMYKFTLAQGPSTSEFCEHCGFKTHVAGPMWAGPLHSNAFIQRILDLLPHLDETTYATIPRIKGMLHTALAEDLSTPPPPDDPSLPATATPPTPHLTPPTNPLALDTHPFFFIPSTLAKVLHCHTPSEDQLRGALRRLGYRVSRSHAKPGSVRTDAPWSVIWEVMREWVRQKSPVKETALKRGTPGWAIMQKARGRGRVNRLRDEVRAALDAGGDVEGLKARVEAALYRAGQAGLVSGEVGLGGGGAGGLAAVVVEDDGAVESTVVGARESSFDVARLEVVFDAKLGQEMEMTKLVRYQLNPRPNWGPMVRAKGVW